MCSSFYSKEQDRTQFFSLEREGREHDGNLDDEHAEETKGRLSHCSIWEAGGHQMEQAITDCRITAHFLTNA